MLLHALTIGGIVAATVFLGVMLGNRKQRKSPRKKYAPEQLRGISAQLTWYFGTYRGEISTDGKNPVTVGKKIIAAINLECPDASPYLRELAERCVAEGRLPDCPESGSPEFDTRAEGISKIIEVIGNVTEQQR